MTTSSAALLPPPWPILRALVAKAWQESRALFCVALVLLNGLVAYAVLTSPGYISRHNAHSPDKPLLYSVYVWSGLFHYALQGLWILCAFVLALGGLAREQATGTALFTLGLPIRRLHLFLIRAVVAFVESTLLGLIAALLIAPLSTLAGASYPFSQTILFGLFMTLAGVVILAFGLLLSEIFHAEFTAPVVGLCAIATIFFSYKSRAISGWNPFDVMSATASIDANTQLLAGALPWSGLCLCLLVALAMLAFTSIALRARNL